MRGQASEPTHTVIHDADKDSLLALKTGPLLVKNWAGGCGCWLFAAGCCWLLQTAAAAADAVATAATAGATAAAVAAHAAADAA